MTFRTALTSAVDPVARQSAADAQAAATRAIADAATAQTAADAAEASADAVAAQVATAQTAADDAAAAAAAALARAETAAATGGDAQAAADAAAAAAAAAQTAANTAGTGAAQADAKAAAAAAKAAQAIADAAAAKKTPDTGPTPTGPGVRMYQGTDPYGNPQGVFELRSGISGEVPGTVTLTAFQTKDPVTGAIRVAGNKMRVRGAGSNGVTPAEWDLNVEDDPVGGYRAVARLLNAELVDLDAPTTATNFTATAAGTRLQGRAPLVAASGRYTTPNTDGAGQFVVTHALGRTPAIALAIPGPGGVIPNAVDALLVSMTTTTATFRVIRRDNNTAFGGNAVDFWWIALAPTP